MFYISSFGGSGSTRLARVLSLHPDVVCFHGARSMPPTAPGIYPDLTAEEYTEALHLCWGACRHVKMFGATHGFSGLQMQEPVKRRSGACTALVRHPVTRLHSLYSSYAAQVKDIKIGDDVYGPLSNELHLYTEFNGALEQFSLESFSREFYVLARDSIKDDMIVMRALDDDLIFRFEAITQDRDYFKKCFENLVTPFKNSLPAIKQAVPEIFEVSPEATPSYLDAVFKAGRLNKHARNEWTVSQVFDAWPDFFKYLFAMAIKTNGGIAVLNMYARAGYDLPEAYLDLDYTRMSDGLWASLKKLSAD